MSRDDAYLLDILLAAQRINSYVGRKTQDDWLEDAQCQDAVVRRFEIIGEAARRISDESRALLDLPWKEMNAMRNAMIHEYDSVDLYEVWDTIQKDIPRLIDQLEKIVPPE